MSDMHISDGRRIAQLEADRAELLTAQKELERYPNSTGAQIRARALIARIEAQKKGATDAR